MTVEQIIQTALEQKMYAEGSNDGTVYKFIISDKVFKALYDYNENIGFNIDIPKEKATLLGLDLEIINHDDFIIIIQGKPKFSK